MQEYRELGGVTWWGIRISEVPNITMTSLSTDVVISLCCVGSTVYTVVMRDVSG
jgi:hypothetical protein